MKRIVLAVILCATFTAGCQTPAPAPAPAETAAPPAPATQQVFAPAVGGEASSQDGQGYPAPAEPASPAPGPAYPAPAVPQGALTFSAADGVQLAGTLTGNGTVGVILAHMYGSSQAAWSPLDAELAAAGYTVLTFDFRGFGQTGGDQDLQNLDQDILGAATLLNSRGISKVVCIGASMGGTACAKAAGPAGLAGLAAISSPLVMEAPLEVTSESLAGLAIPKLFIAARDDNPYAGEIQQMFDWSAEPRRIELLEGSQHGTSLLAGDQGETLKQLILDFLQAIP